MLFYSTKNGPWDNVTSFKACDDSGMALFKKKWESYKNFWPRCCQIVPDESKMDTQGPENMECIRQNIMTPVARLKTIR